VAGEYTTRAPARHRYDLGWSYSTQRYDGGNLATLSDVTDGSRNAGVMYGFDTYSITPALTLTYGGRFAHYDYLESRGLLSPRVSLTVEPIDHFRISGVLSHRVVAPGAEEFSPRAEDAVWLPPQRTFSSLDPGQPLQAETTDHMELEVERDIAAATVSVRAFRQHIDDQLVTVFGLDLPTAPSAVGHYFIGNAGDVDAFGVSAGIRASFGGRVHGSVEYSTTRAETAPQELSYVWLLAGAPGRPEIDRIHDVSTSIEADVPETSTRVVVVYRVSNGFIHPLVGDHSTLDSRFDVQLRQSLPFMDFSTAKWEMLVGVRNFFRDTAPDQSIYDELLVIHPPKRVIGGLTLKF
jgi:outer membrane receptor protein involved in Fe transport